MPVTTNQMGVQIPETSPGSFNPEDPFKFTLRDLVAPFFRRYPVLITTFLVVFALASVIGLLRLQKYESHMAILVNRERMDPIVTTEATNQSSNTPALTDQEVNSEAELLKSRDLLEQVVRANKMQEPHGGLLDFLHPRQTEADRVARAVRALAAQIEVETPSKTNLIEVTYSSPDPALAYGVLNSLSSRYLEKHAAVHRPAGSYQFFAEQAQSYKTALEDAEAGLRAFAKAQEVSDPNEQRTDLAQQLTAAEGQSHTIEQAIAADEERIRNIREQLKQTPERLTTKQETQAANLLLQNLGTNLLNAETKRTQLLLKYDASYPLVQEADQEVAQAKAAIAEADKNPYVNQTTDRDPTFELLRQNLAKDQADLPGQQASLEADRRGIESMKAQMVKLGSQSLDEADLEREAKADEQNYLLYLSKREQERTSDALDRTRIQNVAIAVPPVIPALPTHGTLSILFIAFALAVLISLPTTFIVDFLNPTFHTPAQVLDILRVPVVIAVPKRTA
jgi:uncharacterized protein involved in exopolysaccharide biosynthesis